MVDIGIASASSGTDALSLLRSGRNRNSDDDSSGFLDAMTNSGSGKTAAGADDTTDDDATASDTTTADPELPDGKITGSTLTASADDLAAATIPATAATATTIANAALFPKALTLPASTTLPGNAAPTAGSPSATLQTPNTATADMTAPAAKPTLTDATVADAMASLGVAPAGDTEVALSPPVAATTTPSTDGKAAAQALSMATVVSPASTPTTPPVAQPQSQPISGSAQVVPAQPEVDPAVAAPLQAATDTIQQLAAIVGDGSSALPVVDGKALPTVPTGKTQTTSSGDGDTKTATDTDTTTKADTTTDAVDNQSGAVTDALSLLNTTVPMAAQVQAQVQAQATPGILAGTGQTVATPGKSPTSVSTGSTSAVTLPRGKTSAVVADTLGTATTPADSDDTAAFMPTGLAALKAAGAVGSKAGTTASSDDSSTGTFRIARADGKALNMAISKTADDTTQTDIQTASGTGTETVTVLDSRRYLGLADGSNSALVANTLTGNKDWSSAMRAGPTAATTPVVSNTSKVVNTLKIQMNPEKLGTVTATMRLSGDALSVDLKVQSAEAYRQLSSDQGSMIDSLRAQGYSVDHITVTYAPQATADNSSQQNSNSQAGFQGQQQSGASQGQGGEAQSRRQNSGQRTGDQDGNWGTQNVGSDDSVAGNTQRTRSSGVYL